MAARDRVGDLGPRRIDHATRPIRHRSRSASSRVRGHRRRRSSARLATASTRRPSAGDVSTRASDRAAARGIERHAARRSRRASWCTGRAVPRAPPSCGSRALRPRSSTVDISFTADRSGTAGGDRASRVSRDLGAEPRRGVQHGQLGGVAAASRPPSAPSSALVHAASARASTAQRRPARRWRAALAAELRRPATRPRSPASGSRSACRSCRCRSRGGAERLDRAEALDERAARASSRTPAASASVIIGSRPSGTLATSSPIAKTTASASGQARRRRSPSGTNASADRRPRPTAISQATRRTCALQRALLGLDRWESAAIAAQLGAHAGGEDERPRFAAGAGGAAEDELARLRAAGCLSRADRRSGTPGPTRRSASRGRPRRARRAGGRRPRRGRPRRSPGRRPVRGRPPRSPARSPSRTTSPCGGR